MATPTLTIRIAPEHHDTLRRIAAALKTDPGLPARLQVVLQPAQHSVRQPESEGSAPGVLARLEALEAAVAKLTPRKGRPPIPPETKARCRAFADEVRVFAKEQGVTMTALVDRLESLGVKRPYLLRYLRAERPCSAEREAKMRRLLGMPAKG